MHQPPPRQATGPRGPGPPTLGTCHHSGFWKEAPAVHAAPAWGTRGGGVEGQGQPCPLSSRIPTRDTPMTPPWEGGHWAGGGHALLGGIWGSRKHPPGIPRLCQPAHACMCGFPPRARSNPPTLQQIIKTHLYLICLLELIEFLRSANATVRAASRSLAWNS